MGTRSLTVFEDEDGKEIVVLYRQFDGYPAGHGDELAALLAGRKVVNGFGLGSTLANTFNGSGCMAAAVVAALKKETGGFYLYPAGTRDVDEEYIYTVSVELGNPYLRVDETYNNGRRLWGGFAVDWPGGETIEEAP